MLRDAHHEPGSRAVTIQALQKEGAEYVRRVRRSDSLPCADTGCRVSQRYSFVSYERVGDETTSTKMQAETNKEQSRTHRCLHHCRCTKSRRTRQSAASPQRRIPHTVTQIKRCSTLGRTTYAQTPPLACTIGRAPTEPMMDQETKPQRADRECESPSHLSEELGFLHTDKPFDSGTESECLVPLV